MEESKSQLPTVQPQVRKLYFKSSATEALHSAILLKARNSNQKGKNVTKMPIIGTSAYSKPEPDEQELESPLKIKENLQASVKNIKSGFDMLRCSSDDEDNHSDNLERKKPDIIILDSSKSFRKRGKEEALSNSSSDEEESTLRINKQTNLNLNLKPIGNKPPFITPVVSANYVPNYSESEVITSPNSLSCTSGFSSPHSVKSHKSYSDQEFSSSLVSISSPTSCCSSLTTNDGLLDFDDSSSTASGPVYVRQPGFEHHAHEVVKQDVKLNSLKNFVINDKSKQNLSKKLNSSSSTGALAESSEAKPKAKKKMCVMNPDYITENCESSVKLKPIRQKREPLPLRLRALPASFWEQPNSTNVSPATMFLPPLHRNEIESDLNEHTNDEYTFISNVSREREVRVSPANTELLFKLFDNIEQCKDKKQVQLILNSRGHSKVKTVAKALIKGEDPCIQDAEGLFPQLKLDSKNENNYNSNSLSSSNLPLIEQNYSQILSEIVASL